jgi:hypothetical protein
LQDVIEKPLSLVGGRFEPGLVQTILDDAGEGVGHLALLEHALATLWDRRAGSVLTHSSYDEMGRLSGALRRYADAAVDALGESDRDLASQTFVRLVQLGESPADDTRRPALWAELLAPDRAGDRARVLGLLVDERLLTAHGSDDRHDIVVEIAHEVLINHWPRLQDWVQRDRAALRIRQRLTRDVETWQARGGRDDDLNRGKDLEEAEALAAGREAEIPTAVRDFIARSRADANRKDAAERALRGVEADEHLRESLHVRKAGLLLRTEPDADAERAFRSARAAIHASLVIVAALLGWMILAPHQKDLVDIAVTPLFLLPLVVNRLSGAHICGRIVWSLAGMILTAGFAAGNGQHSETLALGVAAIGAFYGLLGWLVVDLATAHRRYGRVSLPLLALFFAVVGGEWDDPSKPSNLVYVGIVCLGGLWPWVVPAGSAASRKPGPALRVAQTRWLQSMVSTAFMALVVCAALVFVFSPIGQEVLLDRAVEDLANGVSPESKSPLIVSPDGRAFFWPAMGRLISEADLAEFSV